MDKRAIPTKAQEFVTTMVRDRIGAQLSEAALKELTTQYANLTADLEALEALDLSNVEPAIVFTFGGAESDE